MNEYKKLAVDGLWKNNPGFVQLLGLCPLLATSNTVVNALGLGIATLFVLTLSNLLVSSIRGFTRQEIRIPIFVMIIAATVTAVELLMNAYLHELYLALGIFIPLITTNCIILGRAEAYASKNTVVRAGFDGLMMGLGFALVLLAIGIVREVLAQGTLLDGAHLLFGEGARNWAVTLIPDYRGFLLAALPPGAFISLGLLVALKNWIDQKRAEKLRSTAAISNALA